MKRKKLLLFIVVLLAVGLFAGYQLSRDEVTVDRPVAAQEQRDGQPASFEENAFTITTPPGWEKADPENLFAQEVYLYQNKTSGNFFKILVDPIEKDFSADEVWRYAADGEDQVRLSSQGNPCKQDEDFCMAGDGEYLLYIIPEANENTLLKGRRYIFIAGSTIKEESPDRELYKSILLSLKLK